jgi:hypothetical protein
LSAVLIEPAVELLKKKGATVRFGHELREFRMSADRIDQLNFGDDTIAIGPDDVVAGGAAASGSGADAGLRTPENSAPSSMRISVSIRRRVRRRSSASSAAWWNGCSPSRSGCR